MTASLQLRSLAKSLGTEAIGVDLSNLDDATFAWIEHGHTDGPAGARLYNPIEEMRMTDKQYDEKRRPAVVPHPVTGCPILFVNPMHVHGFDGMAKDAAWALIAE
jgi:hypothetical protein